MVDRTPSTTATARPNKFVTTPASAPPLLEFPDPLFEFWPEPDEVEFEEVVLDAE